MSRVRISRDSGKLDLLGMALTSLPPSLPRQLSGWLVYLAVNTNSLEQLPAQLGLLRSLQTLIVRYNILTSLPVLRGLNALVTLDVSNNAITTLPPSIGELPLLACIDCNTNQLTSLPLEICHLRSLKRLTAFANLLASLPEDIGSLPALQHLDVGRNRLDVLPESIGYLHGLVELHVASNLLVELPPSVGQMRCLQKLIANGNSQLRSLPSCGQMASLRVLDVEACRLSELPSITEMHTLRELLWKKNPLQRPPASVATQGLEAIRRYFSEIEAAGATVSRAARLVLLGDGMAGKTSLQRGLRNGCNPQPTTVDARTIQLDLTSLTLFEGVEGQEVVQLSVWDLGGQVAYAAAQQPYIAPGSLYLIVIPAPRACDENYAEVIGRWLAYLQAGAPAAFVLPVLSQCDRLLPAGSTDRSCAALESAAKPQVRWVHRCIYWHNVRLDAKATRLRFHESIPCICSAEGGNASLLKLRATLEAIAQAKPPLLLSIGQTIPRSWSYASAMLRAIRDGSDPVAVAKAAGDELDATTKQQQQQQQQQQQHGRRPAIRAIPAFPSLARPYIMAHEAQHRWTNAVAPALRVSTDGEHSTAHRSAPPHACASRPHLPRPSAQPGWIHC